MARRIIVKAAHKENPDIGLYVQALLRLARQLQAEQRTRREQPAEPGSAKDQEAQR